MSQQDIDELKAMAAASEASARGAARALHGAEDGGAFRKTIAETGDIILELAEMEADLIERTDVDAALLSIRRLGRERGAAIRAASPRDVPILRELANLDLSEQQDAIAVFLADHAYQAWYRAEIRINTLTAWAARVESPPEAPDGGRT